jgi:hypothetical protein
MKKQDQSVNLVEFRKIPQSVVHPIGVEPDGNTNKHNEIPRSGHKNGHTDSDLQKIITAWPSLSCPLKAALLALVQAAAGEGAGHGRG